MASKAIGSFHARASLDATEFDEGAHQMAASLNKAARDIDNAWGIIDGRAVKSAQASARVFEKSGLGPIYEVGTKNLKNLGNTAEDNQKKYARFGVVMQQAGYQVQDFAVQVAGGQNALVAFSQQGSQLLGVFGIGGAIAGAVLSAGILATRLFSVKDAVDETAKGFKTLEEATKGAIAAQREYDIMRSPKKEQQYLNLDESTALSSLKKAQVESVAEADKLRIANERLNEVLQKPAPDPELQRGALQMALRNVGTAAKASEDAYKRLSDAEVAYSKTKLKADKPMVSEINAEFSREADIIAKREVDRQEQWRLFAEARRQNELDKMGNEEKLGYYQSQMKFLESIGEKQSAEYEIAKKRTIELGTILLGQSGPGINDIKDYSRYEKTVREMQSRIPQALQVNTGTSALGGTFGSGPANQIIDIQKGILDGIRQLVRMEMLAGAN